MTFLDSNRVAEFHEHLDEIPDLYVQMPSVMTGSSAGDHAGIRRPPDSRPPLSIPVVHQLDTRLKDAREWAETDPRDKKTLDRYGIIPRVGLWLRMIDEEMDQADDHSLTIDDEDWTDIGALCRHIKSTTPFLIQQQWVTELADDIDTVHRELRHSLGLRDPYRPRCRTCSDLVVGVDEDGQQTNDWTVAGYGRCLGCGITYPKGPAMDALGRLQDFTIPELSERTGIPAKTLHRWHKDRLIQPVNPTVQRGRLFRLDQVLVVRARLRMTRV